VCFERREVVKQDFVLQLLRAHYQNDEPSFRRAALQAAAHSKAEDFKKRVEELTMRPRLLLNSAQSELASPVPPLSFDDLILGADIRASLDEIVSEHRSVPQLLARGLDARRRLLFHGPPGNGKTSASIALASALGISGYVVSLPHLVDSHMGVTAANLAKLFPALGAGVCLVIDEIDSIGSTRISNGDGAGREGNHTVNSLLSLLDRTEGGLLVATTNRRDILDPALIRRFDLELEFQAPEPQHREQLRNLLVERHRIVDREAIYLGECASFDDVSKACRLVARREAIQEAADARKVAAE
jgi:SpoVK/Ycf46/Vps4 family AAA+-type ATPase